MILIFPTRVELVVLMLIAMLVSFYYVRSHLDTFLGKLNLLEIIAEIVILGQVFFVSFFAISLLVHAIAGYFC